MYVCTDKLYNQYNKVSIHRLFFFFGYFTYNHHELFFLVFFALGYLNEKEKKLGPISTFGCCCCCGSSWATI